MTAEFMGFTFARCTLQVVYIDYTYQLFGYRVTPDGMIANRSLAF